MKGEVVSVGSGDRNAGPLGYDGLVKGSIIWILSSLASVWAGPMEYASAPVDNPLKGMVPYVSAESAQRFPHSLEFRYFAMKDLMKGRGEFDWEKVEETLKLTQGRGCQLVMRVYLEYPGKGNEVPPFLIEEGVKVVEWRHDDDKSATPDYADPKLRSAVREFTAAFGKKYDGDRRIGFITAGVLGSWGEWHTYPRKDLWASKEVQDEVLRAFDGAFKTTPVLLRYPSSGKDGQAKNVGRGFGYHDDSFSWATLDSGREADSWFFMAQMKKADALDQWKTEPIGGELRPELWTTSFTDDPHPKDQGFLKCVEATHVSWLMDSGLFEKRFPLPEARRERALHEVGRMGYEYHVRSWEMSADGVLSIEVENRGVAPFYQDWPVELELTRGGNAEVVKRSGLLPGILPGEVKVWRFESGGKVDGLRLRVPNPMAGGKPLRFANKEQGEEWLELMK